MRTSAWDLLFMEQMCDYYRTQVDKDRTGVCVIVCCLNVQCNLSRAVTHEPRRQKGDPKKLANLMSTTI